LLLFDQAVAMDTNIDENSWFTDQGW